MSCRAIFEDTLATLQLAVITQTLLKSTIQCTPYLENTFAALLKLCINDRSARECIF